MEWTYDCQPSIITITNTDTDTDKGTPKNRFQFYILLYYCLPKMSLHLGEVFGQDQQHLQTLRTTAATLRPHQPLHPQLNLNLNWKSPQRDWILKHSEKCRMKVAKRLDLIKTAFYVWARAEMPLSRRCHYATQRGEQKTKVLWWNICNVPFVRSQTAFIVERIGKLFRIVFQLCCITFQLHLEMSDSFQQKQKDKIQVTEKNISFKYLWRVQNHNEKNGR